MIRINNTAPITIPDVQRSLTDEFLKRCPEALFTHLFNYSYIWNRLASLNFKADVKELEERIKLKRAK